jgi:hypothetical protein
VWWPVYPAVLIFVDFSSTQPKIRGGVELAYSQQAAATLLVTSAVARPFRQFYLKIHFLAAAE